MNDYPPGSFGAEMERIESELESLPLPWYLQPLRNRLRRRLQETRDNMHVRQAAALERLLELEPGTLAEMLPGHTVTDDGPGYKITNADGDGGYWIPKR